MRFLSRNRRPVLVAKSNSREQSMSALRRAAYAVESLEERRLFAAELSLTLTGTPTTFTPVVNAGGDITYTLRVTNIGSNYAQNVVITDNYFSDPTLGKVTYVNNSVRQTGGPTGVGGPTITQPPGPGATGPLVFSIGQLNSTVALTFTFTLHVDSSAEVNATIHNSATVTRDLNSTPADPDTGDDPSNNTQEVVTTVNRIADVEVLKEMLPIVGAPAAVDAGSVVAGLDVTYRITVINHGVSDADNVLLSDIVPQYTSFVSFTQSTGPTFLIAPNQQRPLPPVGQQGTVEAKLVLMPALSQSVFLITVHVGSDTLDDKQVFNTATVTATSFDPSLGNNFATVGAEVQIMTDIQVVSSPDKINKSYEGTFIPYTFTIYNKGPSDAQGVGFTWQTPNFPLANTDPDELGVYWDTRGIAPYAVRQIDGPAFNLTIPNPPPAAIGPRGNFTGSRTTLPAGVGSTFKYYVGTPQQQDVVQTSTGATSSPDVDPTNNTYVDNFHIYDAPLIVQTVPNLQANATQGIDVQTMTFIDTNAWPGNIVTPDYRQPSGRFFESFDFNATIDWGDGQTTAGVVSTDTFGTYRVTAQHVYATPGAYAVHTLVTGDGESTAIGDAVALVGTAPRGGAQLGGLKFTENATETKKVGVFSRGSAPSSTTFAATITWGDGTATSPGTLVTDAFGTYNITGTHKYLDQGTYTGSIRVVGSDGVTNTFPMVVVVDDLAVIATPVNVAAQAGIAVNNVTVATFTDPGGADAVGTYTAQIDWGDASGASVGTITYNSGTGVFTVKGTHTYPAVGVFQMKVTINHGTAPEALVQPNATVSTAPVFPAVLATAAANFTASTNTPVTVNLATFTDVAGGNDVVGNYVAVIDWGDGTPTSNGVITKNATTNVYTVSGNHLYTNAGAYPVSVTITHGNSPSTPVLLTGVVTDQGQILSPLGVTVSGVEGTTITSAAVATFRSSSNTSTAADFTATITWGDGTIATAGVISKGTTGIFTVRGTHLYKNDGTYAIAVSVKPKLPANSSPTVIASQARITDAALRGISRAFTATRNVNFSGILGSFTDANIYDMVGTNTGEYAVTVNWGDGTAVTGASVVYNASLKRFDITGTHKYTKVSPTGGFKPLITVIDGTSQVKITSTVTVK